LSILYVRKEEGNQRRGRLAHTPAKNAVERVKGGRRRKMATEVFA